MLEIAGSSEKQQHNINQHISTQTKPRRQTYLTNRNHKAKCLKNIEYSRSKEDDTFTYFNFKKTNGSKKRYSCGGYGGKCASCKSTYGEEKAFRKITIEGDSSRTFWFGE